MPQNLVKMYWRCEVMYCLLLQSLIVSRATNQQDASSKYSAYTVPHGITPQKMVLFIVTAVRTSNPMCCLYVCIPICHKSNDDLQSWSMMSRILTDRLSLYQFLFLYFQNLVPCLTIVCISGGMNLSLLHLLIPPMLHGSVAHWLDTLLLTVVGRLLCPLQEWSFDIRQ
jgi:hypothetical protein